MMKTGKTIDIVTAILTAILIAVTIYHYNLGAWGTI